MVPIRVLLNVCMLLLNIVLSTIDINECANGTHKCSQQCHNTVGSYKCSCDKNFVLDNNGQTCLGQSVSCYSLAIKINERI